MGNVHFEHTNHDQRYVFVMEIPGKKRLLYWRYKPTNENLVNHQVFIYRMLKETSEPVLIATLTSSTTHFVDDFYEHDYYIEPIYQLKIDSGELTPAISSGNIPSSEAFNIRKNVDVQLKFSGAPTLIYPRIVKGERCPNCWDTIRKKIVSSRCKSCYNTSYVGGYYAPILTQVQFFPPTKSNQPGETLAQQQKTRVVMGYYPIINPRDLMVNVAKGSKWRIESVETFGDSHTITHQEAMIVRLNPGDIEHEIPLKDNLVPFIPPRFVPHDYVINVNKGVEENA